MNKSLLFVSPHPDDAELACGGMMRRHLSEGAIVSVAVCTGPGDLKMVHSGAVVKFHERQEEQKQALAELGDIQLLWLDLAPASKFDEVPQSRFVCEFDALFPKFDEVYLPLPSYNADHERVWKAGLAAFRPGKLDRTALFAYEQPMQSHGEQLASAIMCKRYYRLSEDDIVAKMRALTRHSSQVAGREDALCGPAGVEALARLRGLEVGAAYAEMVHPLRETV
jgi:LmbE family N-acetylglucosaminyl deacetylase